jgi:hypothetical protein
LYYFEGEKRPKMQNQEYYEFVDEFITAVKDKWPECLLQFEDFSNDHCFELLERYRKRMRCFNDDIQGTGGKKSFNLKTHLTYFWGQFSCSRCSL